MHETQVQGLRQPLLPKPATQGDDNGKGAKAPNLGQTIGAFVCFVAVRSAHPIIIDISKDNGGLPYAKASPCVINSLIDVIIGNVIGYLNDGLPGLQQCWEPESLKIFSCIAVAYAFNDFLEMQSMSMMGGSVYQILLQSKLLITAMIMWFVRGQRQSNLQWNILITIAIGMSAFMLVGEDDSESPFGLGALLIVLLKVFFSCACAVVVEKYLKAYQSMPIHCQIAQLKFCWFFTSLLLTVAFDSQVMTQGFFSGWDWRTLVVTMSWFCKGWSTLTVLKILNSVLKNIGEAVAILVIYLTDVFAKSVFENFPTKGKDFHASTFLMVLFIVLTVISYTMAPSRSKSG